MLCTVVRWQLTNELDRGVRRGWVVRRHLGRCDACQRFGVRLRHVDGLLVAGAMTAMAPADSPAVRPVGRTVHVLAATAAIVTALVIFLGPTHAPQQPVSQAPPRMAAIETPIAAVSKRSARHELIQVAASWLGSDPLQSELTALKSDALRGAAAAFRIAGFHHQF